ncbi:hypothetical protein C8J57DRAFT_1049780 [Mycena rebaudengoi]|nr:hypothetical protein C8J57DRAFT_1049780 [Mycena rebaudengoi]
MPPYYGPRESELATVPLEYTFLAADCCVGTELGAQLVMYTTCALFLWRRRKQNRQHVMLLGYMTCMLLIELLFIAVQARTIQMIYVDNRNYPAGPWQFFLDTQSDPVNVIFYATLFLLTFLSDLLVLWRCWVIWAASGNQILAYVVTAFPALLLVGSFVMGTLWTLQSSKPTLSMYSALPQAYGTAYYSISLGANVIITVLIIGRLVAYRKSFVESVAPELARHYISLAAVFVESAALYSVFAILFLVTYAVNDPTNQIWLGVASGAQQIANLFIIYRLAEGNAWRKDTLTSRLPSLHFTTDRGATTNISSLHAEPFSQSDQPNDFRLKENSLATA